MYQYQMLYPSGIQQTTTYNQVAYGAMPMAAFPGAETFMNALAALMPSAQTPPYGSSALEASGYSGMGYPAITSSQVNEVIQSVAQQNPELMQQIESAANLNDRLAAVEEIRNTMVTALNEAGYQAYSTSSADKLTVNGATFDILNAAHQVGSKPTVQALRVNAQHQDSLSAGNTYGYGFNGDTAPYGPYNGYGYGHYNGMASGYGEMQSEGIEALAEALFALAEALGYEGATDAEETSTVTQGTLSAESSASTETSLASSTTSPGISAPLKAAAKEIVMQTGQENQALLSKINTAATEPERLAYAEELRDKIVAALNEAGLTAETADSPDKLVLFGQTFDILNSMRQLKSVASLQLAAV